MPIYPTKRAAFVHIPKNGGSTVTAAMRRKNLLGQRVQQSELVSKGNETILDILDHLGDQADSYFKFSFVRNPWDRFVSAYHYVCQRRPELTSVNCHSSFAEFVDAFAGDPQPYLRIRYFRPQWTYLTDDEGEIPLDKIGRFEQFDQDLHEILGLIGVRRSLIRHRKRTVRADYRDYYDAHRQDVIERVYDEDIELFGYSFDDGCIRNQAGAKKLMF